MHQIEPLVDVVERQPVRDQIVDIDFSFHVPVDNLRDVGPAPRATEGGSFPHAAGDQLERPRRDFLARPGDADDDADTPAAVTTFERLAHDVDIADALEAAIGAALGEIDEIGDEIAFNFFRVDEMGHPEFLGHRAPAGVDVDADDHLGADHPAPLDHIETDPTETEDDDIGAGFDLGGVDDCADPSRHAATYVADLVEWCVLADLRDSNFREHGEVRECRGTHVMVDLVPAERKATRAVRHDPLPLRRTDRHAEIGFAGQAVFALPAFGGVERNDVVALGDACHAASDIDDDAGAFMAEDRRKQALRIRPGEREFVGVADPGRLDLDKNLAVLGTVELNLLEAQRLSGFESDSSACLHKRLPRGQKLWQR